MISVSIPTLLSVILPGGPSAAYCKTVITTTSSDVCEGLGMWFLPRLWGTASVLTCLLSWNNEVVASVQTTAQNTSSGSSHGMRIPKTVQSSKLRLVFFVGLEGTGHHYLNKAFWDMYAKHRDVRQLQGCLLGPKLYIPWVMSHRTKRYVEAREVLRTEMRYLLVMENELDSIGTIVTVQRTSPLQEFACGKCGELSYPNNNGPSKELAYPDLRILAEIAEEEGVDLRIIYLQRSAKDLIRSNVIHRGFHK